MLAELAKGRLRPKIPRCAEALAGRFTTITRFLARHDLDHIDTISA